VLFMNKATRIFDKKIDEAVAASIISTFPLTIKKRLLCDAKLVHFPGGSIIYREYDPPGVGLIVSGLIRNYRIFPDGRQSTIWYNRTGDVIGIPLLIAGPWSMNVQVLIDSSILILPTTTFQNAIKTDAAVCWPIVKKFCLTIYDMANELNDNVNGPACRRIARYLLELAVRSQDNHVLLVNVTHQKIADSVGLARETVTRTLNEFCATGLIKSSYCCEVILDPLRLHSIAWPKDTGPLK